jgi:hypothetical protein
MIEVLEFHQNLTFILLRRLRHNPIIFPGYSSCTFISCPKIMILKYYFVLSFCTECLILLLIFLYRPLTFLEVARLEYFLELSKRSLCFNAISISLLANLFSFIQTLAVTPNFLVWPLKRLPSTIVRSPSLET